MTTRPEERTLDAELFNRDIRFDYSETWLAYSLLGLRLVMAWVFLQAGLEKLAEGGFTNPGAWSAAGYLQFGVAETNPLKGMYMFFLDYLWLVEPMVMYGQILIGLALLFGILVRFSAFCGALMMALFWMGAWQGGLTAGFPVEHGYFADSSFVYILLLFGLGAWGAGRVVGVDARLERTDVVEQNPWLRYLMG
jgi:thiosulfate dehydrogenase [quinone] large subunit